VPVRFTYILKRGRISVATIPPSFLTPARHSLGQASWALDHILDHGGSVYLPETLATPHVERGSLFLIGDAPAFARDVYLLINDIRLPNWPWLPDLATSIARRSGWGIDKSTHGERV